MSALKSNQRPDFEAQLNRVELTGILIERNVLRFTPAAVPVMECVIGHQSEQVEAGKSRHVDCEIRAIGLGEAARWIHAATPGIKVHLSGFLAAKNKHSKQLRLHVTKIEFVEGNQNG